MSTSSQLQVATTVVEKPKEDSSLLQFIESDESLEKDFGEMDPLQVIDFLVEQNKKLWNEKIKFENVSCFMINNIDDEYNLYSMPSL